MVQLTEWGQELLTAHLNHITNTCTCTTEDEDGNSVDSPECYGWCWDDAFDIFERETAKLREISDTWQVDGLPLWNRNLKGVATIKSAKDLIRAITVDSSWNLRYKVTDTHIWCYLSHHDVPTGRGFMAYPFIEDDSE